MLSKLRAALAFALLLPASAYYVQTVFASPRKSSCSSVRALRNLLVMQLANYDDPVVSKMFMETKEKKRSEIEAGIAEFGIPATVFKSKDDTMLALMLVEMQLRQQGKLDAKGNVINSNAKFKEQPKKFAGPYEELYWTNRFFREWIDVNSVDKQGSMMVNIAQEYLDNTPEIFKIRYEDEPMKDIVVRKVEALRNTKEELKEPKAQWSGFPAVMGEKNCRAAFAGTGEVVAFTYKVSKDGAGSEGTVEWKDMEACKAFFDKWNGVDMGMGLKIDLSPMN